MATLRIFGKTNAPKAEVPLAGPRMLGWEDLPLKGIRFSRPYIKRLWKAGKFPKPIKISERRLCWSEKSVDDWLDEKIKESA